MSGSKLLFRSYIRSIQSAILFLTFRTVVVSEEVCNETVSACCSGFFWNLETNGCENCKPGYTGLNCTIQCPYPTYGDKCQGVCNCSTEICDMSWGCKTLTTLITGNSLETTMPNLIHPKSKEILLPFIQIIGCVDIILLCAYLALCIHDRTGQEKTMDTSSPRQHVPGRSTAYENIEFASFSVSEMN